MYLFIFVREGRLEALPAGRVVFKNAALTATYSNVALNYTGMLFQLLLIVVFLPCFTADTYLKIWVGQVDFSFQRNEAFL